VYPNGVRIVENHDPIVGRESEIAFDSAAEFKGAGKGGQTVFRKAGAVVQAPVCKTERTRIERIRL